jgi:hypothetical protein
MKTFNYKKSKNALETAARCNKREIYNFLKRAGCPRSFVDEIHSCADHGWDEEFYSFCNVETPDYPTKLKVIRELGYAAVKYGEPRHLRSVFGHFTASFRDAFENIGAMHNIIEKTIKSEHVQKIELIYNIFRYRSQDWSPSDFEDAIATGNMNTLKYVIEMWKDSPNGFRGVGVQMKLATIRHSRYDMLHYLDRFIPGYPDDMLPKLRTMRGKNTPARRDMITYVVAERHRVLREQAIERNEQRRRADFNREADAWYARQQSEEQVSPLHKLMELIEKMKESKMGGYEEGLYLEACTAMRQIHQQIRV